MWSIRFVINTVILSYHRRESIGSCGIRSGNARSLIIDDQLKILFSQHLEISSYKKTVVLLCLVGWFVHKCCDVLSETENILKILIISLLFRLLSFFRFVTLVRAQQEAEFWSTE